MFRRVLAACLAVILAGSGTFTPIPFWGATDAVAAENIVDLVPVMSSNTAPIGTIKSNTQYSGYVGAEYTLFDDSLSTSWYTTRIDSSVGSWLQYQFPIDEQVQKYTIAPPNESSNVMYAPVSWELLASNDGQNWTVIDGPVNASGWSPGVRKEFVVDRPGSYQTYRLRFTGSSNYNGNNFIGLSEVEFIGSFQPRLLISEPLISETFANNGSVTQKQTVTLTSGTFSTDVSPAVIVHNVPVGLQPYIERVNNRKLLVSFTGQAQAVGTSTDYTSSITVPATKIIGYGTAVATSNVTSPAFIISALDADLIPPMTSNTLPIGSAKSNTPLGEYVGDEFTVFDDNVNSYWYTTRIDTSEGSWLDYEFPVDEIVEKYSITPPGDGNYVYAPASWELLATQDGTTWNRIDGPVQATAWSPGTKKEFTVDTPGSYKKYRIRFTHSSNYNGSTSIALAEAEFIGPFQPRLLINEPLISETFANNGTVSRKQTVTLTSGTFSTDVSAGVTVNNLPAGLTTSVERQNDRKLLLTFLGNATSVGSSKDSTATVTVTSDKIKRIGTGPGVTTNLITPSFTFSVLDADLTPTMTSNTLPIGIAKANASYNGYANYEYAVFDDNPNTSWYTSRVDNTEGSWLDYQFPATEKILKYSITPPADSNAVYAPASWELQGTNDGTNWTLIDGPVQATNWSPGIKKEFQVDRPGSYQKYRIRFTGSSNYNGYNYIGVAEVELIGPFQPRLLITDPVVSETYSNDGTVKQTQTVILTSGTFDADMRTGVTVNNLPEGLETFVTRTSDRKLTLTFTGKAAAVGNSKDNLSTVTVAAAKIKGIGTAPSITTNLTTPGFIFSALDADLVPAMVGNTAPIGRVKANASYSGYANAEYTVFDDNPNTYWFTTRIDNTEGSWLDYEFPVDEQIVKYTFTPPADSNYVYAPATWELLGTNDNINWTLVDGPVTVTDWSSRLKKEFAVDKPGSYQKYRIRFTGSSNYSGSNLIALAEAELIGPFQPRLLISEPLISETYANDGSVTQKQRVTLTSGTFTTDAFTGVTVNNLPSGLQTFVERVNDRQMVVSFPGNAKPFGSSKDTLSTITVNYDKIVGIGGAPSVITNLVSPNFMFSVLDADATPTMVSNTNPSGTVKANKPLNGYAGSEYLVFDNNINTHWFTSRVDSTEGSWLEYALPFRKKIEKYSLTPHSGNMVYAPVSWQLLGTNDNINWAVIDTVDNYTVWKSGAKAEFAIDTPGYYQNYRLRFTGSSNYSGYNYIALAEMELISADTLPILKPSLTIIPESSANDGSITVTQSVYLTNAKYADDLSTGVTINNLPAGLGYQVTRVSDTEIVIHFTGRAVDHTNVDDVANASVTVDPAKLVRSTGTFTEPVTSDLFAFDFNNPVFTAQPPHQRSLAFDGVNDKLIAQNVPVNLATGGKNTVEFWIYWDGKANIMPFSWNTHYDLEFINGYFGFNTGQANLIGTSSTGMANKWTHVAAVFTNGTPSPSTVELYLNGQKQNLAHQTAYVTTSARAATSTVRIGHYYGGDLYSFRGKMADVRIWNHARTQSQIIANMNRNVSGNENGLVGSWKLDSLTTKTAYDTTPAKNHAAGSGFTNPNMNLQATEIKPTSVTITWDELLPATSYLISRNGQTVTEATYRSFSDTELTPNTAYTYSVSAKDTYGESQPHTITVTTPATEQMVEFITAEPGSVTVDVYGSQQLIVTAKLSDGTIQDVTKQATYTIDQTDTATLDSNAVVNAVSEGTATITINYEGQTTSVPVTVTSSTSGVTPPPPSVPPTEPYVEFLTTDSSVTLDVYSSHQLQVTAVYSDGSSEDVTAETSYASEDTDVVTVDGAGQLTAIQEGTSSITVYYQGQTVWIPVTISSTTMVPTQSVITPKMRFRLRF
ncbi:discoidin domain-containing protein [Brevibacillus dissolubilis]|uniref:discoidin domain-containing protein n=1 Tax=Brevibacillus dissolubilis TaxID=1844116 RepID=UPI00159BEEB1|nr:discoidin domain-containing protein [Brevibacillus dissolubilis]